MMHMQMLADSFSAVEKVPGWLEALLEIGAGALIVAVMLGAGLFGRRNQRTEEHRGALVRRPRRRRRIRKLLSLLAVGGGIALGIWIVSAGALGTALLVLLLLLAALAAIVVLVALICALFYIMLTTGDR